MKYILYIITLIFSLHSYAHSSLKGKVTDENGYALSNVLVQIQSNGKFNYTDIAGRFEFKNVDPGSYKLDVTLLGFHKTTKEFDIGNEEVVEVSVVLVASNLELSEVVVTPSKQAGINTINAIDFPLRPINTTQDLLRLVPGLFIAQHAGGGKAEQIFLRGFDVDHGTDVAVTVDGMPVNMVSHAHGQGYADLHFVIPETIDNLTLSKGPYDARNGDFNTAGAVRFQTRKYLQNDVAKLEAGSFNTFRGVLMTNVLGNNKDTTAPHHAYVATEYFLSRGFFESPQNFNRLNMFGKYSGQINATSHVTASVSAFSSQWDASGQIPERAVKAGLISRYGSIDNTEGGVTSRYNINLAVEKSLANGATFRNQVFYNKYNFSLFSNFTFFLEDSINGDQIHQFESRSIVGYNGAYIQSLWLGAMEVKTTVGAGLRSDRVDNIGLAHTIRRRFLNDIRRGDLEEDNASLYVDESFLISPKVTLNIGARVDHFRFRYNSTLTDTLTQPVAKNIVSPKLNLYVVPLQNIQLYASAGSGFHSNDARVVTQDRSSPTLPRAVGLDLGVNIKTIRKLFVNATLWTLSLESEFVYVGDAGIVEPSGRSLRQGFDLSARYQVLPWLFADLDFNITQPKLLGEPEGNNMIPLAPRITSIGGLTIKALGRWNGSLRYRYIGDRPAIEDNSIVASGYFITDAVANYTVKNLTLGITIENLFNAIWNEAQFATESRLQGEAASVNEIHYTPGVPFFLKGNVSFSF